MAKKFVVKNKREKIAKLITLAKRISRPSNQIPWNIEQCIVDTGLILELRLLLKEIDGTKKAKESIE